jgi:hypothetical protein
VERFKEENLEQREKGLVKANIKEWNKKRKK